MEKKFELKQASNGQFHFNLKAGNGQVILSSEMYTTKAAALNGITSVQKNAPHDNLYDRRKSKKEEPYFVLKATNGQIIGKSEMYSSNSAMENGISSVKTNAPGAVVEDLSTAEQ
ncbi:YegP family protein [Acaryochloris sp. IP29b_bin.137]|uniref:YegP family protein n=1 Tax=Acaryochloris sp. IP29b_bin.137 TaxID=2969217 RepID=UPI0026188192|nr:YegP family protein [Acaryochloris sp. IP29b_bin.137]